LIVKSNERESGGHDRTLHPNPWTPSGRAVTVPEVNSRGRGEAVSEVNSRTRGSGLHLELQRDNNMDEIFSKRNQMYC
jgi:hypothetical protein